MLISGEDHNQFNEDNAPKKERVAEAELLASDYKAREAWELKLLLESTRVDLAEIEIEVVSLKQQLSETKAELNIWKQRAESNNAVMLSTRGC